MKRTKSISLLLSLALACATIAWAVDTRPLTNEQKALHILNRLTFGPAPTDLDEVRQNGIEAYIQKQLHPDSMVESDEVRVFVSNSKALSLNAQELFAAYGPPAVKGQMQAQSDNGEDKALSMRVRQSLFKSVFGDVAKGKILRALKSSRQLQEVMTDFWFNHFNIFARKGLDNIWIGAYEQQAIRPNALGKFRDLLRATCYHPAMLVYLDNARNRAPKNASADSTDGSNENYARELMELHTLGVDGGYSQKDVTELARILTGLGLPNPNRPIPMSEYPTDNTLSFGCYFDKKRHDFGDKIFLGHVIKGSGIDEIEQALDILAKHPSTARHISYQLAQCFVADQPPLALVQRLSAKFITSDGDIRVVLNDLFHSPEFWAKNYQNNKFKSPFRYLISSLRALAAEPNNYEALAGFLRLQGMPIYGCLTPDGYKNTEASWLNPDMLLRRINFITAVTLRQRPGIFSSTVDANQLFSTLGNQFSAKTLAVIAQSPEALKTALILGSPEFMRY